MDFLGGSGFHAATSALNSAEVESRIVFFINEYYLVINLDDTLATLLTYSIGIESTGKY